MLISFSLYLSISVSSCLYLSRLPSFLSLGFPFSHAPFLSSSLLYLSASHFIYLPLSLSFYLSFPLSSFFFRAFHAQFPKYVFVSCSCSFLEFTIYLIDRWNRYTMDNCGGGSSMLRTNQKQRIGLSWQHCLRHHKSLKPGNQLEICLLILPLFPSFTTFSSHHLPHLQAQYYPTYPYSFYVLLHLLSRFTTSPSCRKTT